MMNKKSPKLIITVSILFLSSLALADTDKEIAKCSIIKGDLDRLQCFDNLSKSKGLDKKQTTATDIKDKGKWSVLIQTNPLDDSQTVSLSLEADSGQGKPIYFIARCQSNKTEVYISWNRFLGLDETQVTLRVGTNKSINSTWDISTDNKATFHRRPIQLLKEMLSSDKILAQVTPYSENPVTASFDTKGLVNAIKPLRETCKW